jgi:Protein of unknown function (DUF1565).
MYKKTFIFSFLLCLTSFSVSAEDYYVNSETGNNRNDGSKGSPFKNIQKAIETAKDGAIIHVAEGNYFGTLDKGTIPVNKPVTILGGYSSDFSSRDVLKYLTMVKPTLVTTGTTNDATLVINVKKPGAHTVIDGLIFDRGNTIPYSKKGDGKPEGVETPRMIDDPATGGIGGPDLKEDARLRHTAILYMGNSTCDITIQNCAFINAPWYGILGTFMGKKMTINNCVFVNCRIAAVEVPGGLPKEDPDLYFTNNTVLFSWSRLKDLGDMGYGFRLMTKMKYHVSNNIIGLSIHSGLDRTRVDSDKNREAARVSNIENNIFFLNKEADLAIPGGGKFMRIQADQFDDVEQLTKVSGNKSLTDPSAFKGRINEAYLSGFLSASYTETTSVDRNSPANTFRSGLGMPIQGTMQSSASMFANRYPWKEALNLFGAMQGYGAQTIK